MNRRIAIKIGRGAHPCYGIGRIRRAEQVLRRMSSTRPLCGACPCGPDDGQRCPNQRACDAWEGASTAILAASVGQHPWGSWKCSMQRAMEGT